MKGYHQSFRRAIRARLVDVNTLNSARDWKTRYRGVFKIKESAPLLRKGDHVRVSTTNERIEKGYERCSQRKFS